MDEKNIKKVIRQDDPNKYSNINKSISQISLKNNYTILKGREQKQKKIEVSWLITDWVLSKGIGLLHSRPGMGKTWWALDFCNTIASGHKFANQWKTKKEKCLYIAAEDPKGIERRRQGIFELLKEDKEYNKREKKDIVDNVDIMELESPIFLDEEKFKNELIEKIKAQDEQYKFIVVDTLQDTLKGSINNEQEVSVYMENIRVMSEELNCFILLVCHEGKSIEQQGQAMGSIRFQAKADLDLTVEYYCGTNKKAQDELKNKIANHTKITQYQLVCVKQKATETPEKVIKNLYSRKSKKIKDNNNDFITIAYLTKDKSLEYTYSQAEKKGKITAEDIAKQFDGEVLPSEPPF